MTKWNDAMTDMLRAMAPTATASEIGSILGMTREQVRTRADYLGIKLKTRKPAFPKSSIKIVRHVVPRFVGATGLTSRLMGDPPPGRSALDQKRAAQ